MKSAIRSLRALCSARAGRPVCFLLTGWLLGKLDPEKAQAALDYLTGLIQQVGS